MHDHLSQVNGQVCLYGRHKLRGGNKITPLGIFLLSFRGGGEGKLLLKRALSPGQRIPRRSCAADIARGQLSVL